MWSKFLLLQIIKRNISINLRMENLQYQNISVHHKSDFNTPIGSHGVVRMADNFDVFGNEFTGFMYSV